MTGSSRSTVCRSAGDAALTLDEAIRDLGVAGADVRGLLPCALARFDHDTLLRGLKDASERQQKIDPHAALRLAGVLVIGGELAARPDHRALGIMARGDALRCLGRYEAAVAALDEAAAAFLALSDRVGWARTRIGWLFAEHCLGRGAAALATLDAPREALVAGGELLRAGGLESNAGWVSYELGRFSAALACYDRAEQLYRAVGPSAEVRIAWNKTNKAILFTQQGRFAEALQLYEEARQSYIQRDDTVSVLRQEQNLAFVQAGQGYYTDALRRYATVLEALERRELEFDAALVALNMTECYLSLNRDAEALALAEETVARFERLGTPTEAAKARLTAATAHARLGDTDHALRLLDEAADAFAAAGLVVQLGLATLQRASVHQRAGDAAAARRAAAAASTLFGDQGLATRKAQADLIAGYTALDFGLTARARALAVGALAVAEERDARWLAPGAQHLLGRVAELAGDLPAARERYGAAIAAIEAHGRALGVALRTDFLGDKLPIYDAAIAASLRAGDPAAAFDTLERAKARSLADYLAQHLDVRLRGRADDEALLDELRRLREEHHWFSRQLDAPDGAAGDRVVEEASAALRDRERRIVRLLDRLALDREVGLDLGADQTPHTAPALDRDTALVAYHFGAGGSTAFVATAAGLRAVPLAVTPADLARLIGRWQLNLASSAAALARGGSLAALGRNARGILGALHAALIAPVAPLLAGRERLIVIPYGPAHAVPFGALHDGAGYLIERHTITLAPSVAVLRLCTERPAHPAARRVLVVAHSDGGRLPAVLDEARMVLDELPGEVLAEHEATRAALTAAAPHYGTIHLAAHGAARHDNPAFAHIQLADGQLSATDIFNLDLRGALVVLSACDTGRYAVRGGDEPVGLSRGFLYAGAQALLQSLWRVEDGATARLMGQFYGALRAGESPATALRAAQRTLLAEYPDHPYHWAPFQLIGAGGA